MTDENNNRNDQHLLADQDLAQEAPAEHEPPPQHPRFKEIYSNWKEQERQNAQLLQELEATKRNQEQLIAQVQDMQGSLAEHRQETTQLVSQIDAEIAETQEHLGNEDLTPQEHGAVIAKGCSSRNPFER